MSNIYTYKAYAKINLALDVIRKREDGYHDLKMIMQKISIYDTLIFKKRDDNEINIICKTHISNIEDNLIYKAIKTLFDIRNISDVGVDVYLRKDIPMEAGLGGGSSDCATTLVAINEIFDLKFSDDELIAIGKTLGADVPFCLFGKTMIAEGIGEKLTPIKNHPQCYYVIAKPDVNVNTGQVFKALDINKIPKQISFNNLVEAFDKQDVKAISQNIYNDLEVVTIEQYPIIDIVKNYMNETGAINTLMSGSGSTVFGIYDDEYQAKLSIIALKNSNIRFQKIELCTPINY